MQERSSCSDLGAVWVSLYANALIIMHGVGTGMRGGEQACWVVGGGLIGVGAGE